MALGITTFDLNPNYSIRQIFAFKARKYFPNLAVEVKMITIYSVLPPDK